MFFVCIHPLIRQVNQIASDFRMDTILAQMKADQMTRTGQIRRQTLILAYRPAQNTWVSCAFRLKRAQLGISAHCDLHAVAAVEEEVHELKGRCWVFQDLVFAQEDVRFRLYERVFRG